MCLHHLDFELPLRGTVYRFSTPGGDVEITARAASRDTIGSAKVVAAALVGLVVVLWIASAARRGRFNRLVGKAGSIVLICLGLLIVFILPVLGPILARVPCPREAWACTFFCLHVREF